MVKVGFRVLIYKEMKKRRKSYSVQNNKNEVKENWHNNEGANKIDNK